MGVVGESCCGCGSNCGVVKEHSYKKEVIVIKMVKVVMVVGKNRGWCSVLEGDNSG